MLTKRLIASLLTSEDRLVKGVQFSKHRYAGNPQTTAATLAHQGIDEISLVDITASLKGNPPSHALISNVARDCFVPLTYGGGIKTVEHAGKCIEAGADKILLNSAALDDPDIISKIAYRLGSQAVVVSIDILRLSDDSLTIFDYRTNTPLRKPLLNEWIETLHQSGAGELKVTSVDREGLKRGFDIDLLNHLLEIMNVPLVFEGGAGTLKDIENALLTDVGAVGLGSMLAFADNNIIQLKSYLKTRGINVRS